MAPSKCCRVLPLTQAAAVARQTPKGSSVCSKKVQVPTVTVTISADALYLGYVRLPLPSKTTKTKTYQAEST